MQRHIREIFRKSLVILGNNVYLENKILCRSFSSQPSDNPFSKTFSGLISDLSDVLKFSKSSKLSEFLPKHCDVLIVGGGVIATSIAFWLKHRALDGLNVVVLEKNPSCLLLEDNNIEKVKVN